MASDGGGTKTQAKDVTVLDADGRAATALERFLGALAVSAFVATWLASIATPLILVHAYRQGQRSVVAFLVAVTLAAYAPWEHGVLSKLLQDFLNRYHSLYYDGASIVFEEGGVPSPQSPSSDRSRQNQTFYAVHPHGAFCIGWALLYHSPVLRGVRFCFAPTLHASPMFRLYARMVNRPGSAARPAMNAYLRAGDDVALPPGGFEEATLTSTTQDRVFIKRRYGFVRLCLKHGVAIRPVYVFGEGRLFANVQGMWKARLALNRLGVPTILVWGRWFFPLLPRRAKLLVVVGRPLVVPKVDAPTKEEVAHWHRRYIDELKRIYEEYKEVAYGPEEGKEAKLEVW